MPDIQLLPAQRKAYAGLTATIALENVAILTGRPASGRTTILRELHAATGGLYLTSREFIEASAERHPLALDETVYDVLKTALLSHASVIVDDFSTIAMVACCTHAYPRQNFLAAALRPLVTLARDEGRKLILATDGMPVPGLHDSAPRVAIPAFDVEDYAALCATYLDADSAAALDLNRIHRFAPKLNARQIRTTCEALRDEPPDTGRFMEHLREHHLASNVDLGEVQVVDLNDLKGLDDVLEALEANVILPLENADVAEELQLRPKRGVLLAGPPGTGKTTIGRALAHRLKSKFFLIDGTVISGSPDFYDRVRHIFDAAQRNAPGIIFIDDSDVIFETGQETGLYRYLLTMLDGLESTSAGRICLIMTAMDVGNLPPAMVRSGRIELWLETRLPDAAARRDILADLCVALPPAIGAVDIDALSAASEGLSGADLRRVVDDGKLLFAFERTRKASMLPATDYFIRAIETVRRNREQYTQAEAAARSRRPARPPWFDSFGWSSGAVMFGESLVEPMGYPVEPEEA